MQHVGRKTIVAMVAVASLSALTLAAAPTQAASPAGRTTQTGAVTPSPSAPAALSPRELSALPLTNRHLTAHEKADLAVVLSAYHAAEGHSLDVNAFTNGFAKDGVFNDEVGGKTYQGKTLGDVVTGMAATFPDVHRDLKSITVNGDEISLELSIQGAFEGPLQTPAGTLKPNGSKIDVPTADFWHLHNGKIETFDCYVGYTDLYAQIGVNLDWASAIAKN